MEHIKNFFKDKDNIIALCIIGFYFLIAEGLSYLIQIILVNLATQDFISNNYTYISIFLNFAIYVILAGGIITVSYKSIIKDYTLCSDNTQKMGKSIVYGILIMYIVSYVVSLISTILTSESSANQEGIDSMLTSPLGYILLFFIIGVIGPVIEELVFRKSVFQVFKNDVICILISSVGFGMIHMLGQLDLKPLDFFAVLLPYVSSGLVFSCLYVKNNRNIIVPIACHIFNNCLSLILIALIY